MAEQIQKATHLRKLFLKLMEDEDPKLDHEKKRANVAARLDEKLGPEWRDVANPEGVEFVPPTEGKGDAQEPGCPLADKMRKAMLAEGMEVGGLVRQVEATPDKPATLRERIQISIERGGDG